MVMIVAIASHHLVRVIAGTHERPARDVAESQRRANAFASSSNSAGGT